MVFAQHAPPYLSGVVRQAFHRLTTSGQYIVANHTRKSFMRNRLPFHGRWGKPGRFVPKFCITSETETFISKLTFPPEGTKRVPNFNDSTVPGSVPLPYPFRLHDSTGELCDFLLHLKLPVRVIRRLAALNELCEPAAKPGF